MYCKKNSKSKKGGGDEIYKLHPGEAVKLIWPVSSFSIQRISKSAEMRKCPVGDIAFKPPCTRSQSSFNAQSAENRSQPKSRDLPPLVGRHSGSDWET